MKTKFLLFVIVLTALVSADAGSAIIHVPGDQPTIQAAITAASHGDTVLVAPGTYFENINFRGKNIVVASHFLLTNDPSAIDATIINGSSPLNADTASCVLIISGETAAAVLQGFTLTGGKGTRWIDEHGAGTYREGGGILTAFSAPTIRNNVIVGNEAIDRTGVASAGGGGIRSGDGNPTILNNLIAGNRARYGAGIVLNYTGAKVRNNVIVRNFGGEDFGGAGIWVNSNGPAVRIIENNTIAENSAPTNDGGGILVQGTSVTARNNIIWGNSANTGSQISVAAGAGAAFNYCDVQGGYPGIGNIALAPAFVDTSYYLSAGSPCIDAGNSDAIYNDLADTLNPSIARFPSRGSLRNDIGAYGGPGAFRSVYFDLHLNDPNTPSSFTAYSDYQTSHAVTLHWTDPATLKDGTPLAEFVLHLYRGSTLIAEVDSGVETFVDTGLILHDVYHYYIRTVIIGDSSLLDSAQAFAGGHRQPKPPGFVTLVDAGDGVHMNWTNPSRQIDNTPLDDLAFVMIYRDNLVLDSVAQSAADTAQPRTYVDSVEGYHSYRLRVRDNESPFNFSTSTDSTLAYGKISDHFTESFESGTGRLFVTGGWDSTSAIAASGTHSLTDTRIGNTPPGSAASILLPPVILGPYPVLRYSDISIVAPGSFAIVDISTNRRKTFQTLRYYDWTARTQWLDGSADPGDWANESIDLAKYSGDTVTIRFRLLEATSQTSDGWYLDDVYAGRGDSAGTITFTLSTSWNMISLPLTVAGGAPSVLFPASVSRAFSFDGKYTPADSLVPGAGYWLKFDTASYVTIPGRTIPKDTLALRTGWNLIGSISAAVAASAVTTIPPAILRSGFYTLDSVYTPQALLLPGKSYWVKSSASGGLVLNSLSALPSATGIQSGTTVLRGNDNWIEFIDAGGHRKRLWLMNGADESVVNGEIPPLPPEGVFDIRFASDRDVETIDGVVRDLPILLQSAQYPVSVRWNFDDVQGGTCDKIRSCRTYVPPLLVIDGVETQMGTEGTLILPPAKDGAAISLRITSGDASVKPKIFELSQNYPNPFNPSTRFDYQIAQPGRVSLVVYNLLGQELSILSDAALDAGYYSETWDARKAPSGVYYARLTVSDPNGGQVYAATRKIVLIR